MCQVCWNGVWNSKSSPRLYCGTAWNFFDVVGCPTWTVYSQLGAKSPLHSVSFYKKRFEMFSTYRSLYFPFFHLLGSLALHGCFFKFSRFSQWFLKFCKKTTFSKIIISVFSIHILIHQLFLTWFPEGPWNDYTK